MDHAYPAGWYPPLSERTELNVPVGPNLLSFNVAVRIEFYSPRMTVCLLHLFCLFLVLRCFFSYVVSFVALSCVVIIVFFVVVVVVVTCSSSSSKTFRIHPSFLFPRLLCLLSSSLDCPSGKSNQWKNGFAIFLFCLKVSWNLMHA